MAEHGPPVSIEETFSDLSFSLLLVGNRLETAQYALVSLPCDEAAVSERPLFLFFLPNVNPWGDAWCLRLGYRAERDEWFW